MLLTIQRNAATPWGTFGTLRVKDLIICSTLEPEWRDNAPNVSCVPPGHYNLHNRPSSLVERLTLGKHKTAWALASVPGRSAILFHPGNFANDTRGCILVGTQPATINGRPGVEKSQIAFAALMKVLERDSPHFLLIEWAKTQPTAGEV